MSCKTTKLSSWLCPSWLYDSGQIKAQSQFSNLYSGDDNTPTLAYCEDHTKSDYVGSFLNCNWNIVGYYTINHSPQLGNSGNML